MAEGKDTRPASDDIFYNLIKNAPFGVYLIDDQFRIAEVSAGAQKVFENIKPLIGHDFDAALRTIWPPPFVDEALARFRHTLATGEPYHSADTVEQRADIDEVESYDWQLERVRLPNGAFGVVCYFYDMTARRRAEAAVRESEARFRNMADHAPVMIWVTERDGSCSFLNQTWSAFTGVEPSQALGFGWVETIHRDDAQATEDVMRRAAREQAPFEIELRVRRNDGEYRWCLGTGGPRYNDRGVFLGHIGSVIDIHERRVAEEHRKLLLDELNHRVKNTLAIVQSIAQQTFKREGDAQALRRAFEGRLAALAGAHSILTATQWESMPLQDVAAEAIRMCGIARRRVRIAGPDLTLAPRPAIAIALALHELCTNALKYGALSNDDGVVDVEWRVESETLHIRWSESGGPAVSPPAQRGFGSAMIERLLAQDIEGDVQMAFEPEGLVCTIEAPLAQRAG